MVYLKYLSNLDIIDYLAPLFGLTSYCLLCESIQYFSHLHHQYKSLRKNQEYGLMLYTVVVI